MVGTDYNAADGEYSDGYNKFNITLAGQLPECLKEENIPE
jgi:hypothetical protein